MLAPQRDSFEWVFSLSGRWRMGGLRFSSRFSKFFCRHPTVDVAKSRNRIRSVSLKCLNGLPTVGLYAKVNNTSNGRNGPAVQTDRYIYTSRELSMPWWQLTRKTIRPPSFRQRWTAFQDVNFSGDTQRQRWWWTKSLCFRTHAIHTMPEMKL